VTPTWSPPSREASVLERAVVAGLALVCVTVFFGGSVWPVVGGYIVGFIWRGLCSASE
jgi:hypothetical protein